MNGEINLESYTLSIVRINTALQKLEDNQDISEIKNLFRQSLDDLEKIYTDTVEDLNQEEVNLNEYYLFFQNGKQMFPQYIEVLETIENENSVMSLILLQTSLGISAKLQMHLTRSKCNEIRFKQSRN